MAGNCLLKSTGLSVAVIWSIVMVLISVESVLGEEYEEEIEGGVDCDEVVQYYKAMDKYLAKKCDSEKCDEKYEAALKWFKKARKQEAKRCYYDIYDDY